MLHGPGWLGLAGLTAALLLVNDASGAATQAKEAPRLADLLSGLGRVAKLYRDSALRFSCDEEITGHGENKASYRFQYVYVYSDSEGFKDYRADPARKPSREIDLRSYRIPQYLRRAYSWSFVFSDSARERHRYELVGEDRLFGRAAFKVRFEPIPPYRENVNEWFGTAWVDRESLQLLRVEALRADQHEKKRQFESELPNARIYRLWGTAKRWFIEEVSTDFTVEKNGMRFPGLVAIALSRYVIPGSGESESFRVSPVYRIEQVYTNYRFFSVRTREEILGRVTAEGGEGGSR